MLTIEDCIALSELTQEEIDAIAEEEHIPEIIAAELGNHLLHLPNGVKAIRDIIRNDIADAIERGDHRHAAKLHFVLKHFLTEHAYSSSPAA
jgi:hypothetical protein